MANRESIPASALEEWRSVVGYEGVYEVSSLGRVRRICVRGASRRPCVPRILRPMRTSAGYQRVTLTRDGEEVTSVVHAIVAAAFLGARPDGFHINHIDGSKTNNRTANLEYCTPAENESHALEMGLKPSGEGHGSAKLSWPRVRAARASYLAGESKESIARRYGIHRHSMMKALVGKNWDDGSDLMRRCRERARARGGRRPPALR